ncbi:MAG: type II toxin-antitoxin system RelE/ParE family toxin [Planctomycetaceae bacterium]|nr:type II toxin-antitoxin system RelE/ParE family toxin [Planctomycetaceae bacterium]
MARLIYAPQARIDSASIVQTIARDNRSAALHFGDELRANCRRLAAHPLIGEAQPDLGRGNLRAMGCGNYIIYYRVVANAVEIVRIIHGARQQDRLL